MRNRFATLLLLHLLLLPVLAMGQSSPVLVLKSRIAKIFDGTTFQLLQTVKLSSDADNIRYDARSKRILVGYGGEKFLFGKVVRGEGDGALAFLDSMGKKTGEIAVDAHPESFQLEKSRSRVFVNTRSA